VTSVHLTVRLTVTVTRDDRKGADRRSVQHGVTRGRGKGTSEVVPVHTRKTCGEVELQLHSSNAFLLQNSCTSLI
jgi:hypothetical protein